MIFVIVLIFAVLLLVMSYYAWRSGALQTAENPQGVLDKPVMEVSERRSFLKRLKRWKEEGKVTEGEYDKIYGLCKAEWEE